MTGTNEPRDFFEIPAENMAKFSAAIAKLSKKSMKLLGKPIVAFVDGTEDRKVTLENGKTRMVRYNMVELQAEMPIVDGYRFVAKLDHTTDGNAIVRTLPDPTVAVPEKYRTSGNTCDHCNVNRRRRDTFLLYNEANDEFRQVGSTCLKDFFGHDVHAVAAMAELLAYAVECARGYGYWNEGYGMGPSAWIDLEAYVQSAAAVVRQFGWTSAKAAYEDQSLTSTRTRATENYFHTARTYVEITDADIATATAALEWARGLNDKDKLSDYEHNIAALAGSTMIESRHLGLAASIIGVYLMNLARQAKRDAEAQATANGVPSNFFGEIKTRYRDIEVKITMVRVLNNDFGVSTLFKAIMPTGEVLSWFTQGNITDAPVGSTKFMTGTVVKHSEFNKVKETGFNRVVLADAPSAPKAKRPAKIAGAETIDVTVDTFLSHYPMGKLCVIRAHAADGQSYYIETPNLWLSGPGLARGSLIRVTGFRSARPADAADGKFFTATKVVGIDGQVDTQKADVGGTFTTGRTDGLPKGYRI